MQSVSRARWQAARLQEVVRRTVGAHGVCALHTGDHLPGSAAVPRADNHECSEDAEALEVHRLRYVAWHGLASAKCDTRRANVMPSTFSSDVCLMNKSLCVQ